MQEPHPRVFSLRHLVPGLALVFGLALCGELIAESQPAAARANRALALGASEDCAACHTFPAELSHPLVASGPSDLPLSAGGRIECQTCHTTPADLGAHMRGEGGQLLRLPADKLCASCHEGSADRATNLSHGLLLGKAHLGSTAAFGSRLDPETRECLSCHDGISASSPSVREGTGRAIGDGIRFTDGVSSNHPIAVPQEHFGTAGRNYVTSSRVDPAIRLFAGQVGCGSCHSVYGGQPAQLAISNHRSALCLECHVK